MSRPKLDAVAVTSGNLPATAKFYELLGFQFPKFETDAKHIEPVRETNEARLMIDDKGLMESILGHRPSAPNHSTFALKCASPAELDAAVKRIEAAGHKIIKQPWDAFWGQRYAIVADPDGYMVDLFAALSPALK